MVGSTFSPRVEHLYKSIRTKICARTNIRELWTAIETVTFNILREVFRSLMESLHQMKVPTRLNYFLQTILFRLGLVLIWHSMFSIFIYFNLRPWEGNINKRSHVRFEKSGILSSQKTWTLTFIWTGTKVEEFPSTWIFQTIFIFGIVTALLLVWLKGKNIFAHVSNGCKETKFVNLRNQHLI